MRVTAIVPVWNRIELLESLLEKLAAQSRPPEAVLVIDNGSSDGSAEEAERRGARVIRMGRNTGFASAVNRGIRETQTELVAVINNDVEPSIEWLERLREAIEAPDAWFACGKLLDAVARDRIDGTYDLYCRGGAAWRAGHGRPDGPAFRAPRPAAMAPFTATLFRAALFQRIGPLDEGLTSYLEDVDFGLRCTQSGLRGIYVPEAVAYHAGSATLGRWSGEVVRAVARNQIVLIAKHYPPALLKRLAWPVFVAQALWGLVALRHARGISWARGVLEGLRRLRRVRRPAQESAADFESALLEGEAAILRLQRETGFDFYWRVYFFFTGGGSD
jgi:GT2 family glycosyltransferase